MEDMYRQVQCRSFRLTTYHYRVCERHLKLSFSVPRKAIKRQEILHGHGGFAIQYRTSTSVSASYLRISVLTFWWGQNPIRSMASPLRITSQPSTVVGLL